LVASYKYDSNPEKTTMNPLSYVWFWLAIVAIIAIIVAFSFSEGVGQSFGNNKSTPLWVWILWGVGILLLIVSFILYCIAAARDYKARRIEEVCNPKPKVEESIVCPVKKPCGCPVEVKCACVSVKSAPAPSHDHGHQSGLAVAPINYSYPDIKAPTQQPHLYYGRHSHGQAQAPTDTININIQEQLPPAEAPTTTVYTSLPQAPGYPPLVTA